MEGASGVMSGKPWTSREISYLEDHAGDGAKAIAEALGRSVASVKHQASRYGLSLRLHQMCPRCGRPTYRPLSKRTGWCVCCTKERQAERQAEQVRELEEEARREVRANKERQRLYSRKYRARKQINGTNTVLDNQETEEE